MVKCLPIGAKRKPTQAGLLYVLQKLMSDAAISTWQCKQPAQEEKFSFSVP
jgi:hypothetical protein